MSTRHIWIHAETGRSFLVARSESGELTAASALSRGQDPLQALRGALTPDAAALGFVRDVRRELHEQYELDEEGHIWSFGPVPVERDGDHLAA
jgi:hypothetical protein